MSQSERRSLDPALAERIQQSLVVCWKEGIAGQIMISITDYYLIPFALYLGASSPQVGLLVAIPNLLASIFQLFAVRAVRAAKTRRRLLLIGTALQIVTLIPVAFLPFYPGRERIFLLIISICLFRILGNLIGPAWGSLVSEYLPEHRRGQYFGWRARIVGLAGVAAVAVWGVVLYLLKKQAPNLGFTVLFLAAALARFVSFLYMTRMVDLPLHRTPESDFTFWMFLRRFRESNFVKFIFYVSTITFATHLSAPYFSIYMLRDLRLNYLNYMAVNLVAVVAGLFSFPIWGRHADHVGNARILKTTSLLIPFIPVMWLFSTNLVYIIVIELAAGFIWGGFNLCVTNFIFDAVSPEKRVRCLGYFNLINGVAICAGAGLGGVLAERLPPLFGYKLYSLFVLSGSLRLLAHFFLSQKFREVRASAHPISSTKLFFSVVGLRPLIGQNNEWLALPPPVPDPFKPRAR